MPPKPLRRLSLRTRRVERFSTREWILIVFNLACYASVVGHMMRPKQDCNMAIDLDNDIRLLALDDEDLWPLWNWIGLLLDLKNSNQG